MNLPDRQKYIDNSWRRLNRFVEGCIKDPDNRLADNLRKMPCEKVLILLHQYRSIARLHHKNPKLCLCILQMHDASFLRTLYRLTLLLNNGSKTSKFELTLMDLTYERERKKHSDLYNELALNLSWRRFNKYYFKSPLPGDENVDYEILPQFEG